MFEDASVNAGAVQWPDADSAFWTVRRMQIKLHRWASEDHARRFGDLFNLVYDPAFLVHAWERVSSNAGRGLREWIGPRWPELCPGSG
jgi:RNA-directed DNA polymerase